MYSDWVGESDNLLALTNISNCFLIVQPKVEVYSSFVKTSCPIRFFAEIWLTH